VLNFRRGGVVWRWFLTIVRLRFWIPKKKSSLGSFYQQPGET